MRVHKPVSQMSVRTSVLALPCSTCEQFGAQDTWAPRGRDYDNTLAIYGGGMPPYGHHRSRLSEGIVVA